MLKPEVINKTIDTTVQQVTTDVRLWREMITFQADGGNTGVIRIFYSHDGSSPAQSDPDDAFMSLEAGQAGSPPTLEKYQYQGEQFRLSNFYFKGSVNGDVLHVMTSLRVLQPTS